MSVLIYRLVLVLKLYGTRPDRPDCEHIDVGLVRVGGGDERWLAVRF